MLVGGGDGRLEGMVGFRRDFNMFLNMSLAYFSIMLRFGQNSGIFVFIQAWFSYDSRICFGYDFSMNWIWFGYDSHVSGIMRSCFQHNLIMVRR